MTKTDTTDRTPPTVELTNIADVLERYQLIGPHATIVIQLSTPGQVGDDRSIRWHARRHELIHAGAGPDALAHLDRAVDEIDPRGVTVLLTANHDGVAHCWLMDHEVRPSVHVGEGPALLPAIDELADRAPVIAAIIDHLGADIYAVDHLDITRLATVKGDHVQTHRHVGGDQAGHQRRADGVYERNAEAIAKAITTHANAIAARLVVLTGDTREIVAVEHHLDRHRFAVRTVQAGARHESDAIDRLRAAASEHALHERSERRAAAVSELRQALGRHSLGVEGREATTKAISEGRLATLLLDRAELTEDAEARARDTLLFGGRVVVAEPLPVSDGMAGLLRYDIHE